MKSFQAQKDSLILVSVVPCGSLRCPLSLRADDILESVEEDIST